jgi:hypothetical protein
MGACGCGEGIEDHAVKLPDGTIVAYGVYPGCDGCHDGLGFSMRFYDTEEHYDTYAASNRMESIIPDCDGGNEGFGVALSVMGVDDLVQAAAGLEADGCLVGEDEECYESIADWMRDNGLRLIQDAIRRHAKSRRGLMDGRQLNSGPLC